MVRHVRIFIYLLFLYGCGHSSDRYHSNSEENSETGQVILLTDKEKLEIRARFDTLTRLTDGIEFSKGFDVIPTYLSEALSIAQRLNNDTLKSNVYFNFGGYFDGAAEYQISVDYYFKALEIYQKQRNYYNAARTLNNLSWGYIQALDFNKGIEKSREGIEMLKNIQNESTHSNLEVALYNNLAIAFLENGTPDSALKYNELANSFLAEMKSNDTYNHSWVLTTFGCIYLQTKDYVKAKDYFNRVLENKNLLATADASVYAIGKYSHFLNSTGQYREAIILGREGFSIAKGAHLRRYQINIAEELRYSYEKLRNIDSAYVFAKINIELKDSIFNEKKTIQLQSISFNRDLKAKELQHEIENAKAAENLKSEQLLRNIFLAGFVLVILFAVLFLFQRNKIRAGKIRSDELLLNILPEEVAEELKQKGSTTAKQFENVTVMFTDFKNFSQIAEKLSPQELVSEIHYCFEAFDHIIEKYPIEKIKTIGDSYMCAGGLPVSNHTHAYDVVSAAVEIQQFIQQHLKQRESEGKELFEIRIGIHTGPVVAGIVGVKKFAYDIWGDTVNTASRMESSGEVGKVNISATTYELVKNKFNCIHRGKINAKNKGEIDMYFVEGKVQG